MRFEWSEVGKGVVRRRGHFNARDLQFKSRTNIFLNGPFPTFFSFILVFLKQTVQFLQKIHIKNVHLVDGAGIHTHNLQYTSLPP